MDNTDTRTRRAGIFVERAEIDIAFWVFAHPDMYLAVCVYAFAALAVQLGEIDDVTHLLGFRIKLVEMRSLGMCAEPYVYLAALCTVECTPH